MFHPECQTPASKQQREFGEVTSKEPREKKKETKLVNPMTMTDKEPRNHGNSKNPSAQARDKSGP